MPAGERHRSAAAGAGSARQMRNAHDPPVCGGAGSGLSVAPGLAILVGRPAAGLAQDCTTGTGRFSEPPLRSAEAVLNAEQEVDESSRGEIRHYRSNQPEAEAEADEPATPAGPVKHR